MAAAQPVYTPPQTTPTAVPPLSQLNPAPSTIVSAGSLNQPNTGTPQVGNNSLNNTASGDITMVNGVATRAVDPNALTSNQLSGLENTNSPLSQLALAQGANNAAATGNSNGTLMAGASENALLSQLTPIASQNAQVFERQAQSNQDALNTAANTERQVAGSEASAGIGANASMHNAQLAATTAANALAQNQEQFKSSQAFTLADQATQNQFNLSASGLNSAISTIFSDPSYWSNPTASMGMLNYFGSNINSLIDNLFPQVGGASNAAYANQGYTPTAPNQNIPNATAPAP